MKHHSFDVKVASLLGQAYHRLVQVRTGRALFVSLSLLLLPAAVVLSLRGFSASAPWLLFLYLASALLSCFFVKRSAGSLLVALPVHLLFIAYFTSVLGPVSIAFFMLYLALWISALPARRKKALAASRV